MQALKNILKTADLKSIDSSSAKRCLCLLPLGAWGEGKGWRLTFHKEITY